MEVAGDTGCRRLAALIDALPHDSALLREGGLPSLTDHLIAAIAGVDLTNLGTPADQDDSTKTAADTMREIAKGTQ